MVKQIQNLNNLAGYVTLQHVLQARDVLIKNNKNQKNNNLVYYNHHANLGHFVVQFEDDKNKQYKPNELLRIAYLIYQNVDIEDESQIAENYKNLDNVLSNNLADADEANSFLNNLQSEKDTNLRSEEDTAEIVRNGQVLQESRHKLKGGIVKSFEPDKFGKSPKAKATVEAIAVGRSYREIWGRGGHSSILRRMTDKGFIIWTYETPLEFKIIDTRTNKIVDGDSAVVVIKPEDDEMDENVKLLKQFKQMIFYGPPGTGKTYNAKWTLRELFGVNKDELPDLQGDQWDIVQFHPSYNYEDFVRGVQVNTNDEGQIKYETKNRIFAEMCDKASRDEGNAYALIIDEINRANVSSVLGELIYALEYRGESVSTPYEIIGSRLLTIPPNLYIIGTMNTADRTIGALDYAVRRRFAFVHCPPDESLIADAEAKSMFDKVKRIFADFLSPDFDAADVKIGHSYFMAEGEELHNKIQYQVIPILEEYVKDGVLLPEAKEEIEELRKMLDADSTASMHPLRYMNVGEQENRNWDDCRQYGYLGGDGEKSVQQMKKHLRKGDWVFAFINGKGCVGYGEITQEAIPIREFITQDGTPLLECELRDSKVKENSDNDDSCEWVVGVQWLEVRDRENAVPVKAARGQTVWLKDDDETRQKLDDAFNLITYDDD